MRFYIQKNDIFKKKNCIFLDSKIYEYNNIYEVPQSKTISKEEKIFLKKKIKRLLKYEINKNANEEEYSFIYYMFPVLINIFLNVLLL